MNEYNIIPEFRFGKFFPFLICMYQLLTIILLWFAYSIDSTGFILVFIVQFCALYYLALLLINKFYRLDISSSLVTIYNVFHSPKTYSTDTLRWKIVRIPWYCSYYLLLYSSAKIPIAIIVPLWKNALKLLCFPHMGKVSSAEKEYIMFLKSVGLLKSAYRIRRS